MACCSMDYCGCGCYSCGCNSYGCGCGCGSSGSSGSPSIWNSLGNLGGSIGQYLNSSTLSSLFKNAVVPGFFYEQAKACAEALNKLQQDKYNQEINQMNAYSSAFASGIGLPQLNISYAGQPAYAAPGSGVALAPVRTVANTVVAPQKAAKGGIMQVRKHLAAGSKPQGIEELMIHIKSMESPKQKFDKALKQVKKIKKTNPAKYRNMLAQVKKIHANRMANKIKQMTMQKDIQTALQKIRNKGIPSVMPRRFASTGGAMSPVMQQGMPQGGLQQMMRNNPQLMQQLMQRRQNPNQMQQGKLIGQVPLNQQIPGQVYPLMSPITNQPNQMQLAAGGGIMGYATGGSIPEIDYRDKGGYVPPIGKKERADDIPAMLSNNEFVFTANAVRNAGDGDVKHGAKKMYALMKHLEGKK